jgi:hypothetical protein
MADKSGGGGATPFLAFLVGALIVVVAVLGFSMYGQGLLPQSRPVDVKVSVPKPTLPDMPTTPNPAPTPPPLNKPSI